MPHRVALLGHVMVDRLAQQLGDVSSTLGVMSGSSRCAPTFRA